MKAKNLVIQGMSCAHCVMSVRKALEKIPGVRVKEVAVGHAVVEVEETTVRDTDLAAAVTEAGYTLIST